MKRWFDSKRKLRCRNKENKNSNKQNMLPGELLGILELFVRAAGILLPFEAGILRPFEAGALPFEATAFPNPISAPPRAAMGSYSSPP